jgi:hypothetical protein
MKKTHKIYLEKKAVRFHVCWKIMKKNLSNTRFSCRVVNVITTPRNYA